MTTPSAQSQQKAPSHPFLARLADTQRLEKRKVLVYGPPRAGKTRFLGTAAFDVRTSPILVLDFDNGGSSLEGLPRDLCTVVPITQWDEYSEAYDYLFRANHPYKAVAIDSTSETHIYSVLNIVDEAFSKEKSRRMDDLTIEQGDYGKAMVQMRRFLREFRNLPLHVFFTSQMQIDLESGVGQVRKPAMFGKMADELVGMFGVTSYLGYFNAPGPKPNTTVQERRLLLTPQTGVRVGTRAPWGKVLPEYLVIPENQDDGVTQLFDLLESVEGSKST